MDANTFQPGPLGAAHAEPDGERWTLVFVRDLKHPVEKVWRALIEPEQLTAWSPWTADRSLDGTGPVTLSMFGPPSTMDIKAEVRMAEAPHRLEYEVGGDLLRWELAPTAEGTRLTLRHTVTEREQTARVAAGWHLCLVVAEHLLDGDPIDPIRGEDALRYGWENLESAYRKELDA